jgi:hypothetical protein
MSNSTDLFVLYKLYPNGGKVWLMLGMDSSESDYNDIWPLQNAWLQMDMR